MDTNLSPDALLVLAKQHLGLPKSVTAAHVPRAYIEELKTHTNIYPHDVNFRIALEPGRGFGKVTCLEEGCAAVQIPLVRQSKMKDGGIKDGLGSLSAYRYHVADHPTHSKYRHARVKAEVAAKMNGNKSSSSLSSNRIVVKKDPSNLLRLDLTSPLGSPASLSTPMSYSGAATLHKRIANLPKRTSSLTRVPTNLLIKPEPAESIIPRKRLSDSGFGASGVKHQVNDDSNPFATPSSSFSKKQKIETPKTPLARVNGNTGSSESVLVQRARPPALSVEEVRIKLREVQDHISLYQSSFDRLRRKKRNSKADLTKIKTYTRELERLLRLKEEYNASIPSMSPIKRTSSNSLVPVKPELPNIPRRYNSSFDRKPFLPQAQPIASGSNVQFPYLDTLSDDEMQVDVDPALAVLQRVMHAIPVIAPMRADHHDADGDFHGRGKDTFIGPQAKADDIDKFLLEAGNAEQFDGNASIEKALEKLGLQAQYQLLPGMEVALMPHQTIGVAWMIDKEQSTLKGSVNADEMGLGKTVQMIAVLVKNQSTDPMCKTNLIIAPTALLDQWKLEIEMKTNNGFKCLVYHGQSKPKRKQDLLKYDVVLTTYSTMALEWPDLEAEQKAKAKAKRKKPANNFIASDSDDDSDGFRPKRKRRKEVGLLFQVDFYRIVLDEAQSIRNRRTRTSRAVTDLRSIYRWCLTGTPIVNGLVDVYGYFRFLKIRPWYDFTEFQGHIGSLEKKNPALAVTRLQAIISTCVLRRMKNSMLDGKRLIELPDKEVSLIKLEFSEEERDIYKMVEARTQANFNRYLRAGTVLKNYSQVLVLLLRLRQICSHPSLIQEDGVAFVAPHEVVNTKPEISTELTRAKNLVSADFVIKMKQKFKESTLRRIEAEKESADAAVDDEECPICFDAFTDAVVTPCAHMFCRECLVNVFNSPLAEDINEPTIVYKQNERPCPACRSAVCAEKMFSRVVFEPTDTDLLSDEEKAASKPAEPDEDMPDVNAVFRAVKSKAKAKKGPKRAARRPRVLDSDDVVEDLEEYSEDDDDDMSDFIVQSDEDEEEKNARSGLKKRLCKKRPIIIDSDDEIEESPEDTEVIFGAKKNTPVSSEAIKLMPRFLPSTKMKYMMETLRKLATERPDEKTLIVSQWTGCLALVSDYLTEAGVLHVKYQGDMNRVKRDQAVRVFMSKDKARVMLMSLKCGGVGLNLTRANNVISLDLGWSRAIEAQAFDRCHRLGQTRPVVVQRLVIADTVEDRVLAMQERKQNLADGSLGEGSGKKIGRLSVRELANLFGLDHRGRVLAKD